MISFFDKQTDRQFYNYSDPAPFFLLISEQNLEAASFKSSSRMLEGNSLESDWMSIFIDRLLVDIRVLRSVIRQFWEENALSAPTTCNVAFIYISQETPHVNQQNLRFFSWKDAWLTYLLSTTWLNKYFNYKVYRYQHFNALHNSMQISVAQPNS